MDRVLQPLEERLKLVDSSLQGLDAPLVPRIRRPGSRVRSPPAATQLNNASEDRQTPHRPPTWIAGTRDGPTLRLPLSRKPREGRRSKTQRAVTGRAGLISKTRQPRARPRPRASWCPPDSSLGRTLSESVPRLPLPSATRRQLFVANDAPAPNYEPCPPGWSSIKRTGPESIPYASIPIAQGRDGRRDAASQAGDSPGRRRRR